MNIQSDRPKRDHHVRTGTYAVVWPRSEKSVTVKPLAPRLATLEGKTVAFLWDYLFRGDEIWPILSEAWRSAFPA